MEKIGRFRSIPVYKLNSIEWRAMETREDERLYIVSGQVYYHDQLIGYIDDNGELANFDEILFESIKRRYIEKRAKQEEEARLVRQQAQAVKEEVARAIAETPPQVEERPVRESVDAGTAIEEFMASWRSNIDNEIEKMKQTIGEIEFNAFS